MRIEKEFARSFAKMVLREWLAESRRKSAPYTTADRTSPKDLQPLYLHPKWREEEKRQQIELKLGETEGRGAKEPAQEEEVHVQHAAQSVDPDCQAKILKLLLKGSTDEQVSAHVMGANSAFKNGAFKFTLARRFACGEHLPIDPGRKRVDLCSGVDSANHDNLEFSRSRGIFRWWPSN
jgi:hypothetical protein